MKKKIHPAYKDSTIVCVCGEVIHTKSTKPNIKIDICSKCHPFFTGQQKLVDSAGMVEKFKKRYEGKVKEKKKKKQKREKTPQAGDSDIKEVPGQKTTEEKEPEKNENKA